MNRLSALDAFSPAFSRVNALLFQRFKLSLWLKVGFIGLLGGGVVTAGTGSYSSNNNAAIWNRPEAGDLPRVLHSIHLANYLQLFLLIFAVVAVVLLIFQYLFCRFRFILFDTVVLGQPGIKRGWRKYESQANRYFGFWIVYRLVNWAVMFVIVGLPLWQAYKNGFFSRDNSIQVLFATFAPLALKLLLVSIVFAVISTVMKDFVLPVLALDDFTLGDAWSAVWRVMIAEPQAWVVYMLLKLVCSVGAAIVVGISFAICMIPVAIVVAIPAAIFIGIGVMVIHAGVAPVGASLCVIGGLLVLTAFVCLFLIVTAPVSIFFPAYAFYFFAGRYPKLAALLWPPTPSPQQPLTSGAQPVL